MRKRLNRGKDHLTCGEKSVSHDNQGNQVSHKRQMVTYLHFLPALRQLALPTFPFFGMGAMIMMMMMMLLMTMM